jgi:DNA-directed RNA polymerase beta subunit
MANLSFLEKVENNSKKLRTMEDALGKGLMQPFMGSSSSARRLMWSTHKQHVFSLMNPEKAILETGYEIRFGDYSSSITRADSTYVVIGKISKFSFAPNHHYWLIVKDTKTNKIDIVERISYHYITESYCYLYNNEYMDNLSVGDYIPDGTIVQKSLSFDEYNNRAEGINMNVAYLALDDNMEDSIIFSDVAANRLTSPLVKPVEIMINDNDIPINLYGKDNTYKIIPDIGEEIIDANLIALRKEKKEESYFTQSINNLSKLMISDDKRQVHGRVIDLDIYCNNPDILDSHYYAQIKMYYNEQQRYNREIVELITPYVSQGYTLTYDAQKMFANAKRVMNHDMYIDKRTFSNIILKVSVLEEKPMEEGDKASNRYGGKGVCSAIWPQNYMPRYKNAKGEWEYVDVIFNSSTMINRENVGQTFELSINHISSAIIDKIIKDKLNVNDAYNLIYKFVSMCSTEQAAYMEEKRKEMSDEELMFFVESIIDSGNIQLSMKPISEAYSIDKLNDLYKAFPWIEQNKVEVAIESSDGTMRYVPARRRIVVGKQYIYRLKQYAEEKYSATSLSSTNIRNENTKSRVKKDFRELYPNTPIRFGNMETNNMAHIGVDALISNMMIHSLSPQGRRLVEQMYTGDPFNIDIKLDSDSKNRSAEIANTYLKTVGRRIRFIKERKKIRKVTISPITFNRDPIQKPISFVDKELREGYDYVKAYKERLEFQKKVKESGALSPIKFKGIDIRRKRDLDKG